MGTPQHPFPQISMQHSLVSPPPPLLPPPLPPPASFPCPHPTRCHPVTRFHPWELEEGATITWQLPGALGGAGNTRGPISSPPPPPPPPPPALGLKGNLSSTPRYQLSWDFQGVWHLALRFISDFLKYIFLGGVGGAD